MEPIQDILVGIDFDAELNGPTRVSERAALQARDIAKHSGARVTLMHSSAEAMSASGGALLGNAESPRFAQAAQPLLDSLSQVGVACEFVLEHDRPWLDLIRRVLSGRGDLVIVGMRERLRAGSARYGTNARKLLRKCPCPVWIVHPHHELLRRVVLAATDGSEVGRRVLHMAADVAESWDAQLHVVHAIELTFPRRLGREGDDDPGRVRAVQEAEVDARAEIGAALLDAPRSDAHLHLRPGYAHEVILECIDEVAPDLLVMGTVSRTGVAGLLIGNTAERLLDQVESSVLAVKPVGFRSPVEV